MSFKEIGSAPDLGALSRLVPASPGLSRERGRVSGELASILLGRDGRLIVIAGPCSADDRRAVLSFCKTLSAIARKVEKEILVIPRIFTEKPRTLGAGYMGMLHDCSKDGAVSMSDALGLIRRLFADIYEETGFTSAIDALYPETYPYYRDFVSYVTIGARSSENQLHRLFASGLDVPAGIKNPLSGSLGSAVNAVSSAGKSHRLLLSGKELITSGNPLAHVVLRGESGGGTHRPNFTADKLLELSDLYSDYALPLYAAIVDTNHGNSGKDYRKQPGVVRSVMSDMKADKRIKSLVKGFMIEAYIEEGAQPENGGVFGKSITDGCLGIGDLEGLIYWIAENA